MGMENTYENFNLIKNAKVFLNYVNNLRSQLLNL